MSQQYNLTDFKLLESEISKINTLPLERAMNLPEHFQCNEVGFQNTSLFNALSADVDRLSAITESKEADFEERYLAATILSVLGDPRIKTLSPTMIDIPACSFTMGIPKDEAMKTAKELSSLGVLEEWILKECPEISVNLASYRIAKYLVTNADYKYYLDHNEHAEVPSDWRYKIYPAHLSNHPVHSVSLEGINAYISWLNQTTNRSFRLPTEAEWEFAARGLSNVIYPWGNRFEKDHANTVESGLINTTPIGLFPKGASHCGCLDMAGNVEEYTSTYYAPYNKEDVIMDDLLETGPYVIARGGSYTRFRDLARTTRRHGKYASALYVMGFRLAEDLPG